MQRQEDKQIYQILTSNNIGTARNGVFYSGNDEEL
jgi:hypothetical protein